VLVIVGIVAYVASNVLVICTMAYVASNTPKPSLHNPVTLPAVRSRIISQPSLRVADAFRLSVLNRPPLLAARAKKQSKGFGGGSSGSRQSSVDPPQKVENTPAKPIQMRDEFERAALGDSTEISTSEDLDASFAGGIKVFLVLLLFGGIAFGGGFLLMDCLALLENLGGGGSNGVL